MLINSGNFYGLPIGQTPKKEQVGEVLIAQNTPQSSKTKIKSAEIVSCKETYMGLTLVTTKGEFSFVTPYENNPRRSAYFYDGTHPFSFHPNPKEDCESRAMTSDEIGDFLKIIEKMPKYNSILSEMKQSLRDYGNTHIQLIPVGPNDKQIKIVRLEIPGAGLRLEKTLFQEESYDNTNEIKIFEYATFIPEKITVYHNANYTSRGGKKYVGQCPADEENTKKISVSRWDQYEVKDKTKLQNYKKIIIQYLQTIKLNPKDPAYKTVQTILRDLLQELQ